MSEGFDLDRIGGRRGLRDLVSEVLACGDLALRLQRDGAGDRAVIKPDRSPVTEADRAIEARLRAFLAREHPDAAVVGEEEGASGPDRAALRFVIDPIDGTRAFLRGVPTWSVLVGLEADGVPSVGVALLPAAEQLFVAVRGEGAEGNGRPLRVSLVADLSDAMVQHGAVAQFFDDGRADALARLSRGTFSQRGFADFEGYRQVLLGRAEAMVDPGIRPWDVCAAAVLVREAGGRFTALDGEPTIYGPGGLASNGLVHDALVAMLKEEV